MAYTAREIEAATFVDVTANKEVQENLLNNVKISFEVDRYSYKVSDLFSTFAGAVKLRSHSMCLLVQATHNVSNKKEVLYLIRTYKDGIPFADLEDGYLEVRAHVQDLRKDGEIWMLQSTDQQREILYPNDPRVKIGVDEDVKALVGLITPLHEVKENVPCVRLALCF